MITTCKTFNIFFLALFIISVNIQSQEKGLYIEYDLFLEHESHIKRTEIVKATETNSISSLVMNINSVKLDVKTKMEEKQTKRIEKTQYFKDYQENILYSKDELKSIPAYVKENLLQFQWKLTGETKNIIGYDCQGATTTFRGREYTAYFTTKVPFKAAPFKFYGLPGVILEVTSKDGIIKFEATSLKVQPKEEITNPFKDKELITWDEFASQYEKKMKEFKNKVMSVAAKNGMDLPEYFGEFRIEVIVKENKQKPGKY